jgi:ABC-2 type transport system permease protein
MRTMAALILEYRVTVLLWMLAGVTPLIMMFVWRNLAASGPIGGRDAADFSSYFLIAFLAIQICQVWVVWDLDFYIRSGSFSVQLLRPYDPWFSELFDNIAANSLRLPINLLIVIAGLSLTGGWHLIAPERLPLFLLSLGLAWQLSFNMNYALALLCLWTERIKAIDTWFYITLYTLGGGLFPLDLFSPGIRAAIAWTPFPWMVNFPVELLTGHADPIKGLAMQALWIGICLLCHRLLWARGLKRFGAVGG